VSCFRFTVVQGGLATVRALSPAAHAELFVHAGFL